MTPAPLSKAEQQQSQHPLGGICMSVALTASESLALHDHAKRLNTTEAALASEIVGKVLSDNLVDAVLDR